MLLYIVERARRLFVTSNFTLLVYKVGVPGMAWGLGLRVEGILYDIFILL